MYIQVRFVKDLCYLLLQSFTFRGQLQTYKWLGCSPGRKDGGKSSGGGVLRHFCRSCARPQDVQSVRFPKTRENGLYSNTMQHPKKMQRPNSIKMVV